MKRKHKLLLKLLKSGGLIKVYEEGEILVHDVIYIGDVPYIIKVECIDGEQKILIDDIFLDWYIETGNFYLAKRVLVRYLNLTDEEFDTIFIKED